MDTNPPEPNLSELSASQNLGSVGNEPSQPNSPTGKEALPDSRSYGIDRQDTQLSNADFSGSHLEWSNFDRADLTEANLQNACLQVASLKRACLLKANLANASLTKARLQGANLQFAILEQAELSEAKLQGADLQSANLANARLSNANLEGADLSRGNLEEAWLRGATLADARLEGTNLRGAYLGEANLRVALLHTANMQDCKLPKAILAYADLSDADLRGARLASTDCRMTDFSGADLRGALFSKANLERANLTGADLRGADFTGARLNSNKLKNAKFDSSTILPDGTPWTPEAHVTWMHAVHVIPASAKPSTEPIVEEFETVKFVPLTPPFVAPERDKRSDLAILTDRVSQRKSSDYKLELDASLVALDISATPSVSGMPADFITKFLKGSVSASGGTFATIICHFMSITLMTRWTTKETLGLYFLILAIANGGKIFASLGLDLTLVRFLVSEKQDVQRDAFTAIVWTRILVLIIMSLLTYIFGNVLLSLVDAGDVAAYRWYIPILFTLMSFRELLFYVLQGLEKYHSYAILQTASALFKLALIGIFVRSLDLTNLILIEFAMLGVSIPFQLRTIHLSELNLPSLHFDWSIMPRILRFGLPLYANSVLSFISNYGAVFIVGIFLSSTMIAAYEVARKIPEGFMRLFLSFQVVYFPSLSSLFGNNDLKNAQKLMNKSLVLLATGVFLFVLSGLLFSHEIVLIVFSESYLDVQTAFVLLLLAVCLHLLASTMGYSLVSAGYPELSTKANIIAIGMELLLSLLLIPTIGYVGGAIAYVLMTIVAQVLSYIYLCRIKVNVNLRSYAKPFLFLFVMSSTYLIASSDHLLWRVMILNVYVALCVVFIPDCHQAVVYLRDLAHKAKLQQSN